MSSASRSNIKVEIKNNYMEMDSMDVDEPTENVDAEVTDVSSTKSEHNTVFTNLTETRGAQIDGKMKVSRAVIFDLDENIMSDLELESLHTSLGITENDAELNIFEGLHMYGVGDLKTHEIKDFFGKYRPDTVEWISDMACNVFWSDKNTATRVLHELTTSIRGMPVTNGPKVDSTDNLHRSILLKQPQDSVIHVSQINMDIPAGYWRLSLVEHPSAEYILIRYTKTTDKVILQRARVNSNEEQPVKKGNPWGTIARNWHQDITEQPADLENRVPAPPSVISPRKKSILQRLGTRTTAAAAATTKRSLSVSDDDYEKREHTTSKVPRMRMYADEEEARLLRIKQLKKIRALDQIITKSENKIQMVADLRTRITRQVVVPPRKEIQPEVVDSDNSEDEQSYKQRSKVTLVVKKPRKPTVASTIWSRLDTEKRRESKTEIPDDSESSSDSDSSEESRYNMNTRYDNLKKTNVSDVVNNRPGFKRDIKAKPNLSSDHKSPLRIEINNDHYKNS